jgi:DNA-binding transcriptional LysR family regulator
MFVNDGIRKRDMARTLDLGSLRSFVAVADVGGVTRASGLLNLTQSAVSMQIKRLEEGLGQALLDRSGRGVALTAAGEQLLGYARRMLDLNDEVLARMTDKAYEGMLTLGVPHDIVYPVIPQVLQRFAAEYPRVRVQLVSLFTRALKEQFARGDCDVILTTEDGCDAGGETLMTMPLVWVGAPGGGAWKGRPLKLAFEHRCIFRQSVQAALDEAGIAWEMAVESDQSRTIEASVSADLAVNVALDGSVGPYVEPIAHGGALPELGQKQVNLYRAESGKGQVADDLVRHIRQGFRALPRQVLSRAA